MSQIAVGLWSDPPGEGAENPRVVNGRTAFWPDPLEGRRAAVEVGAGLVDEAVTALAKQYGVPGGPVGGRAPGEPHEQVGSGGGGERSKVEDHGGAEEHSKAKDHGWADEPGGAEKRGGAGEHSGAEARGDSAEAQADVGAEEAAWAREVDLLIQERDAMRTGELTVLLPAHLSASRVVALAADPVALAERLRRPMPEQPSPQARRGSAFHAWLERRFGAAALVDVDELPGAGDDVDDTDLEALQAAFLGSEWASRTAEAVEVAIETSIAGVVLRGRIDAVFARPGGGWDVVDWKTGRPPAPERAQALAVQLAVYRLAWARLHAVPVEQVSAAFFYASTGETVRPVDLLDEAALHDLLTLEPSG